MIPAKNEGDDDDDKVIALAKRITELAVFGDQSMNPAEWLVATALAVELIKEVTFNVVDELKKRRDNLGNN